MTQVLEIRPDTTPMSMLERAVSSGASIEVLERLLALQERWQANTARIAFTASLSALRADMPEIVKSRKVDFSSGKGRTTYQYEDLAEMVELLSPQLAKHGMSFRWRTDSTSPGFVSVTCILAHADGHCEETTLSGPCDSSGNKNAIQAIGSVVTYLQRYTLKASLGIAASQDDDGRQGAAPGQPAQAPAPSVSEDMTGAQRARYVAKLNALRQRSPEAFDRILDGRRTSFSAACQVTDRTAAAEIVMALEAGGGADSAPETPAADRGDGQARGGPTVPDGGKAPPPGDPRLGMHEFQACCATLKSVLGETDYLRVMEPYGGHSNKTPPEQYHDALLALSEATGTLHGPPDVACLLQAQSLSREELRAAIPKVEEAIVEQATLRDEYLGEAGIERALVASLRVYYALLLWLRT